MIFIKCTYLNILKEKELKQQLCGGQIDGKVKEERSRRLIELSNENEKRHNEKYIGKEVEVLFEEREGKYIKGHTTNYMVVKVTYRNIENSIEKVKIVKEENLELVGGNN